MIVSTLSQSKRIEGLHPLFKEAFDYIKNNDLLNAPLGRIELKGDDLFINNVEVDALEKNKQVLEIHRKYIDIHVLLSGQEIMGWLPTEESKEEKQAFDVEADCALYTDAPSTFITMRPQDFVIVYPEDAHAPIIGTGKIRKLIVKVKL